MDAAVIRETARQILHAEPPNKVVRLAESYALQTSASIPLKPNVEPARIYVCCVLAIERLSSQLALHTPDTKKPPVPPQAYVRLLGQFRQTLRLPPPPPEQQGSSVGSVSISSVSSSSGNRSVSGQGGRHQTRAARRKAGLQLEGRPGTSPHEAEATSMGAAGGVGGGGAEDSANVPALPDSSAHDAVISADDDDHYDDSDDDAASRRSGRHPRSAHKRAPSSALSNGEAPAKKSNPPPPPRKRAKSALLPTSHAIDEIGGLMALAPETTNAVRNAFEQYRELVKDPWGLVYGLFAVISERAEPRMGVDNLNHLDRALREVAPPRLYIDPNEWIPWVERIVTGQTWIMKISKRPEPAPKLVGAPGGWGLSVEFSLVDEASSN